MRFLAEKGELAHQGQIVYKSKDLAFDFFPHQISDCTILIGTINVSFILYYGDIKRASQIWGLHPPLNLWQQKKLEIPQIFQGTLTLLDNTIEEAGILQLEGTLQWKTYYDPSTGWVCIGANEQEKNDLAVEFATNTVAVVNQQQLKALWVRPLLQ